MAPPAAVAAAPAATADADNGAHNADEGEHPRLLKGQTARLPDGNTLHDGFFSRLLVRGAYPLISAGRRGALRQRELRMPADQAAESATSLFEKHWAEELKLAEARRSARLAAAAGGGPPSSSPPLLRPSLLRALRRSFGWHFAAAGVYKLAWSGLVILGASYFVNALVEFVQRRPGWDALPNNGVGWALSCAFFLDALLSGLALQRMGDTCVRCGIRMRAALMASVYRKAFRVADVSGEAGAEDADEDADDGNGGAENGNGGGGGGSAAGSGGRGGNNGDNDVAANDDPPPTTAAGGSVVSLVSTDCAKVYEGVQHLHNVWTAPVECATIIALLLWRTGGAYGLPALGVVLVVLPLQYYLGYRIARYKSAAVEISDARVLRMHEVLLAVKLVKFYAWERPFARQVEAVRAQELRLLRNCNAVKTANLCLVFFVPPMIALVIYATYGYTRGPITPAMAFVVLSLFNTLRFPLVVLPKALRGASEAAAALSRLQRFLLLPEVETPAQSARVEVRMTGAELHYGDPADFLLRVPKFEVKPGQVVAVVGRVGAGKSSILQAALSRMRASAGTVAVGGNVAYVPQSPWVQNLSVRDNILFGLPYHEGRYRAAIHACALELDLEILPGGDAAVAGERGINLSGGQRQRVCLARAAYHGADVLLLDNPLSAVDQHTSKHIFDHCIRGLLRDKAVVLVAHQLELLPRCDAVAVVVRGEVAYFGPPSEEALALHMPADDGDGEDGAGGGAAHLLMHATVEGKESGVAASVAAKAGGGGDSNKGSQRLLKAAKRASGGGGDEGGSGSGCGSSGDGDGAGGATTALIKAALLPEPAAPPLPTETAEEAAAKFSGTCRRLSATQSARYYLHAGGGLFFTVAVGVFALAQATRILSDWWIRSWSSDQPAGFYAGVPGAVAAPPGAGGRADLSAALPADVLSATRLYLVVYASLVLAFLLLLLTRDSLISAWAVRAAARTHADLFRSVLQAPVLFFLRTPVGDVLNAFARDQVVLDETLPDTAHMTLIYACILLTSLGIVIAYLHLYAVMAAVLLLSFALVLRLYLPAATLLKRWAGETASAVFVHVDETLQGMDVVRAFGCADHFVQENVARINRHGLALFATEQCHLWLAFWCDLFGAVLVVATCLLAVGYAAQLGAASVGLAISNSIQILVFFTWVVRGVADVVSMWDAVERVASYARNVPSELGPEEAEQEERAERAGAAAAAAAERELRAEMEASGVVAPAARGGILGRWLWSCCCCCCCWLGRGRRDGGAGGSMGGTGGGGGGGVAGAFDARSRVSGLGPIGMGGGPVRRISLTGPSARSLTTGLRRTHRQTTDAEDAVLTVRRIVSLGNGCAGAAAAAAAAAGAAAMAASAPGGVGGGGGGGGAGSMTCGVSAAEVLALSVQHKRAMAAAAAAAAPERADVRIHVLGGGGVGGKGGEAEAEAAGAAPDAPFPPPASCSSSTAPLTTLELASWPCSGDLRFDDVCLRYFPGGPLALKRVSFHVRSGEKVGVVGRTGSGKTTLLMALFRMLDLAGGRVLLGGIDASRAPLRELRRRVAIIPQEPVMFKGTVRSNLDPFGACSDGELWHCLALVHLKAAVAELPGGLDAHVSEGGANFSLGRRQLVCMARCVLRRTRVLVLDEATAAMDLHTDALVQRTVRRAFAGRTTLTIAHRLDTIIHSDRVLSMARGEVVEFGAPEALLADARSMFSRLVEDTGPVASAALRKMAEEGPPRDD